MRTGIALGSNLGDRLANLGDGRDLLLKLHEGTLPAAVSAVYETSPVGCPPGSPAFLNAVMEIETTLRPAELLEKLAGCEQRLGRAGGSAKNSPRPLDLDILYAGDTRMAGEAITLPHPRLHLRRFVLQPLADIRPELVLPGQTMTIAELLAELPDKSGVRLFASDW
ncbi:MAG: 2-amino-4-hydroxy-6-hydroxymethyldihydropteridine diphosphokinase [Chthoniobacterales bacterium]|nr:2-amino-4-hydroxy-6-hydroxymethyldihydropteridine diphosphokinase [Chthoniobacterales bacterium]